jgi:hypothetical protein
MQPRNVESIVNLALVQKAAVEMRTLAICCAVR